MRDEKPAETPITRRRAIAVTAGLAGGIVLGARSADLLAEQEPAPAPNAPATAGQAPAAPPVAPADASVVPGLPSGATSIRSLRDSEPDPDRRHHRILALTIARLRWNDHPVGPPLPAAP